MIERNLSCAILCDFHLTDDGCDGSCQPDSSIGDGQPSESRSGNDHINSILDNSHELLRALLISCAELLVEICDLCRIADRIAESHASLTVLISSLLQFVSRDDDTSSKTEQPALGVILNEKRNKQAHGRTAVKFGAVPCRCDSFVPSVSLNSPHQSS
jgi:hypothetical protein